MAKKSARTAPATETYTHPDATGPMRPEVGTQAQFRKKLPPTTYRYDSSLAPQLQWDGGNAKARDEAGALLREIADCGLRIADLAKKPEPEAKAEAKRLKTVEALERKLANSHARLARF